MTAMPQLIGGACSLLAWGLFFYIGKPLRPIPSGDAAIALGAAGVATLFSVGIFTFAEWVTAGFRWPYRFHFILVAALLLLLAVALFFNDLPRPDAHPIPDTARLWLLFIAMCLPYAIPASVTRWLLQRNNHA
jgi:hypothetical protein